MKTYTIGQLAEKTGLTRRALRLYEQAGLLVPGRDDANNYRRYTAQQIIEAEVIRDLRASGLSVSAISNLFAIKRANWPVEKKLARALTLLDQMRAELLARRQAIDDALQRLDADRWDVQQALEQRSSKTRRQTHE